MHLRDNIRLYICTNLCCSPANDSNNLQINVFFLVSMIRERLNSRVFINKHKRKSTDFTRNCFFCFRTTCVMLLQKTLKSVQLHIHSLAHALEASKLKSVDTVVTAGAWTRARAKLKHSAFIELNEEILPEQFYSGEQSIERFQDRRLPAIDGSVIALPSSPSIFKEFGEEKATNQKDGFVQSYAQAQCSVLYDLLNNLALKAQLSSYRTSELSQAKDLVSAAAPGDIIIADRGYGSAAFMARVKAGGADFVIGLNSQSFKASRELFEAKEAGKSVICQVQVKENNIGQPKGEAIRIRLVSIDIPGTGEREVLATSLLDEAAFPTELFGWIYHQRWGIETYFHQLKNRLDIENFSGRSVESIYQDFYAMLFISNFESVLTIPAQKSLNEKKKASVLDKQVNHSVSYHAIKEYALDLFFSTHPEDRLIEKLTALFQMNPTCKRNRPPTPHNNTSVKASANYRKRLRKITF